MNVLPIGSTATLRDAGKNGHLTDGSGTAARFRTLLDKYFQRN
jgi:hypothetical protein